MPPLILTLLLACPTIHRYPDGSGLEGQLEREVIALKQHLRAVEAELQTCGEEAPNSLYAELYQVFSGSEVGVEVRGAATVILVRVSHLYSDPYSLEFREEADRNLDLIATALNLHPEEDLLVLGHTNDNAIPLSWQASRPTHLSLSLGLATSLMDHLVAHYDIDRRRFTIAGRGTFDPLASNDLETGQDANQRLEIFMFPPGAPPPAPE